MKVLASEGSILDDSPQSGARAPWREVFYLLGIVAIVAWLYGIPFCLTPNARSMVVSVPMADASGSTSQWCAIEQPTKGRVEAGIKQTVLACFQREEAVRSFVAGKNKPAEDALQQCRVVRTDYVLLGPVRRLLGLAG